METREFLRSLPLLAELPDQDLDRLATSAERVVAEAGEIVMEEGSPGDGLYILVDGELEVVRGERAGEMVLCALGPGTFLGEMSLVEHAPRNATIRATRLSELLVVSPADFNALLTASPAAAMTILRTFAARLRSTEASLRQNAQLISLGTLAAGLAHELNNPAAALSRGAAALMVAVDELDRCARRVGRLGIRTETLPGLGDTRAAMDPGGRPGLAATNRLEDEVAEWLDGLGMERPFALASPLVEGGWTVERLRDLVAGVEAAHAPALLDWLAARSAVAALAVEIGSGAAAITEIVGAVRAHTFLGQSPIQSVDVAEGLDTSLVILRGRIGADIQVVKDYSPDRPRIEAYGGALNQVWTNLIDNAIHAVDGAGTITLRVKPRTEGVTVEVEDTGPGIDPDVLPRIFDPFFTTRPFGVGTGLGLHVAFTVVQRHQGRIEATSRPGHTVFRVLLPSHLPRSRP